MQKTTSHWFVVRTNPNCEPRAIASLQRAGFGPYSPTYRTEHQHHRTKAWVTKCHRLMPGYLFVDTPADGTPDWFAFRKCDGVKSVLGVTDGRGDTVPFPIPSRLVERIMAAQSAMAFDQTREAKAKRGEDARSIYQPGLIVSVTSGPFISYKAEVDHVRPNGTIASLISLFGRMTPVELDPSQVELIAA